MSIKLPFGELDPVHEQQYVALTASRSSIAVQLAIVCVILIAAISTLTIMNPSKPSTFAQVKSGELTLYCLFQDGERAVDPDLITEHWHEYSYWKFTNGGAGNCRTE